MKNYVDALAGRCRTFTMSEYFTSKKCWQCGDWLVRTRGANVRYYHCAKCTGSPINRNGKMRHPFEENKDVIAALSLLRIGTMLLVDGSRPIEWCSDALRLHAGALLVAPVPTGRKRASNNKTKKRDKRNKKDEDEDDEYDGEYDGESDEDESASEMELDDDDDSADNDVDDDDDVDDKIVDRRQRKGTAFCRAGALF